jgi:hypothetical protein
MWDVSQFMKMVKQRFTHWHNKRQGRRGTLWEERFRSVLVEGAGRTLVTMAYMFLERSGTETMAPIVTSEAVKYDSSSATLDRVRGMTVMIFIGFIGIFILCICRFVKYPKSDYNTSTL